MTSNNRLEPFFFDLQQLLEFTALGGQGVDFGSQPRNDDIFFFLIAGPKIIVDSLVFSVSVSVFLVRFSRGGAVVARSFGLQLLLLWLLFFAV